MKHADGDTMTHMLRLTAGDLDVGWQKKKNRDHTTEFSWHDSLDTEFSR